MTFLSIIGFLLLWIVVIAPLALSIPKDQKWLEEQYNIHKYEVYVFWPYFLIKNYTRGDN